MLSVTDADRRYQDIDKDAAAKDGMWASFKGPTPYFDKYHEEGEEQDIELLTTTDDWWWYGRYQYYHHMVPGLERIFFQILESKIDE